MKNKSMRNKWRLRGGKDNPETTAIYTARDYEAMADEAGNGAGILRLATGELKLPSGMKDLGDSSNADSFPKVVTVIVVLSLIFILVITYFVMQMPPKQ